MKKLEPYNFDTIQNIKEMLLENKAAGTIIGFQYLVDGVTMVRRTTKLEQFNNLEQYIKPNSKIVEIRLYTAGELSPYHEKHRFSLLMDEESLNGIGADSSLSSYELFNEKIAFNKMEYDFNRQIDNLSRDVELLKDKNTTLTKKLEKKSNYIKELESDLDTLEDKLQKGGLADKITSALIHKWTGTNAEASSNDQQLSGEDAEFTSSQSKPSAQNPNNKKAKSMMPEFSNEEQDKLMMVIAHLYKNRDDFNKVNNLLNINPESDDSPKTEDQ